MGRLLRLQTGQEGMVFRTGATCRSNGPQDPVKPLAPVQAHGSDGPPALHTHSAADSHQSLSLGNLGFVNSPCTGALHLRIAPSGHLICNGMDAVACGCIARPVRVKLAASPMSKETNKTYIYIYVYLPTYLSIYLANYLSTYVSIYLSVYLSIYPSIFLYLSLVIYVSVYLSIYVSIFPLYASIYLPTLPTYLPIYLCIHVSVYLCIRASVYLCTYLSVYPFTYVSMYFVFIYLSVYLPIYLCS